MKTVSMVTLAFIGLLIMPTQLHALTCYRCDSGDGNCQNPNFFTYLFMSTCDVGMGYCVKATVGNLVSRGCSPLCVTVNILGSGTACCSTGKCNASSAPIPSLTLLLFSGLFAAQHL